MQFAADEYLRDSERLERLTKCRARRNCKDHKQQILRELRTLNFHISLTLLSNQYNDYQLQQKNKKRNELINQLEEVVVTYSIPLPFLKPMF